MLETQHKKTTTKHKLLNKKNTTKHNTKHAIRKTKTQY